MLETPTVQPQYKEYEFSSAIDCKFCSRLLGMKLVAAWLSSIDPGIMNTKMECISCHNRVWERIAIPEVINVRLGHTNGDI
jgi:hypothetical protein